MDVIARRAFERPDVEANRAGDNPRQHGSCLAHGAKWSQDGRDAIAFGSGGSVTELSVTGRYRGGGDEASMEPSQSPRWSILYWSKPNQTRRPPTQLPCDRNDAVWKNLANWRLPMPRYFFDVKNGHRRFDASGFVCEDDTDEIIRATVLFIWQSKASLWIFIRMTQL